MGADGSLGIEIYPNVEFSATSPEEVDAHDDAACEGCMYADACPLIPHVAAELHYTVLPCPVIRSTQKAVASGSLARRRSPQSAMTSSVSPIRLALKVMEHRPAARTTPGG